MPTLYLDMDGVLADFNGLAAQVLNADSKEKQQASQNGKWSETDWKKLRDFPGLYRKLSKTDIADDLVDLARLFRDNLNYTLSILTAVPKNNDVPDAFHDKIEWIQEHYPDLRVRFGPYSTDKQKHAQKGDILVDDRKDNCDQWSNAGGTAIRVIETDRLEALTQLRSIYYKKLGMKRLASL